MFWLVLIALFGFVLTLLRDLFGAHTFERNDRPGVFHRDWSAG